jgi:hypothetical protein
MGRLQGDVWIVELIPAKIPKPAPAATAESLASPLKATGPEVAPGAGQTALTARALRVPRAAALVFMTGYPRQQPAIPAKKPAQLPRSRLKTAAKTNKAIVISKQQCSLRTS